MKIKALLFLLVMFSLLIASDVNAETATISGRIIDAGGKPADDVTVYIGKKYDFTDAYGKYRIKNVPYGEQKMQIKRNRRVIKEINIKVNETRITQDVKIE